MDRRTFLLAIASLPLAARAQPEEGRILEALRRARFRLLGEVHDNPEHHAIRARLLDALGRSGLKPAVAFEQFDSERQEALEELQGKDPTADDIARAVRFDRKGWNWEFYRPLVEVALKHGMPLRAAGLSAEKARMTRVGEWEASREETLRNLILEGHCRAIPESALPRMVAVQRGRDRQMAQALLRPSAHGAVLIAGNGHVRKDVGVPAYLPAGDAVSVGLLEETPAAPAPYDFVWVTAPAQRPDPCEAFRRRK